MLATGATVAAVAARLSSAALCTLTQTTAVAIAPATSESTIVVSGLAGTVASAEIRILGLTASEAGSFGVEDFDLLLVPPDDERIVLMSNACASEFGPIDLYFAASGSTAIPTADDPPGPTQPTPCQNATLYRPGDYAAGVYALESPAPAPPYSSSLSPLAGIDPNGTWHLYAAALNAGSSGSVGSWQLRLTVDACAAGDNTIFTDDFETGACSWSDQMGLDPACAGAP